MALNINDFISRTDFNALLTAVKEECNRRHYNNALTAPNVNSKNEDELITYADIYAMLNSIRGLDAFPHKNLDSNTYISTNKTNQYVVLKNFQYSIIKALNTITTTINTAKQTTDIKHNTDCRGDCAGLCTGCTSCSGTCTGGCKTGCKGGCKSCTGTCAGCSSCTGGCEGCSGTCAGTCTSGCARGCASYYNVPGDQSSDGRPS